MFKCVYKADMTEQQIKKQNRQIDIYLLNCYFKEVKNFIQDI